MRAVGLLSLGLLACQVDVDVDAPERSGIAIGNPPSKDETALARVTVADGIDVEMVDFDVAIQAMYLEDCDGLGQRIDVPTGTVLSLDGSTLQIPVGTWCGIAVMPSPRAARLRGLVAGRGRFRFENPLGRIGMFSREGIDLTVDDTLVLELAEPGWLVSDDFDVRDNQEQAIGGEDCLDDVLCDRIRRGLMNRAGLFRDPDRNGEVDDNERDRGSDAAGDERRERTGEP